MKPDWQIAWLQSPKILAFTEAIARKYVHLRAQAWGKRESRVLRSLFCRFKTLVSFPEAAAFAWLDQADLGLSRRPRPSPLDGSSASHATCNTRGAVPRRTARVPGESAHSRRIRTADYAKINKQPKLLPSGLLYSQPSLADFSSYMCSLCGRPVRWFCRYTDNTIRHNVPFLTIKGYMTKNEKPRFYFGTNNLQNSQK